MVTVIWSAKGSKKGVEIFYLQKEGFLPFWISFEKRGTGEIRTHE